MYDFINSSVYIYIYIYIYTELLTMMMTILSMQWTLILNPQKQTKTQENESTIRTASTERQIA